MLKFAAVMAAAATALAGQAAAQLMPYEDYQISDKVYLITTVKVDANKGDDYLEGLQKTWIASQEVAKELGHIADYSIFGSATPQSGDFNMLLVTELNSMADMAPSKKRFDEFMASWGEKRVEMSREVSETYPDLREIKGEYVMHELMVPALSGKR
jgi:hypothetical protein